MSVEIYSTIMAVFTLVIIALYCKAKIMIGRHNKRVGRQLTPRILQTDLTILNEINSDVYKANVALTRSTTKLTKELQESQRNVEALTSILNEKNHEIDELKSVQQMNIILNKKLSVRDTIIKSVVDKIN